MDYLAFIERSLPARSRLSAEDRKHMERVMEICRALAERPRQAGLVEAAPEDDKLKVELGRLVELLGRRGTPALPAATLGRAALADLSHDLPSLKALTADCEHKLAMLGF